MKRKNDPVAELPLSVRALLDVAAEQREIREARARSASRRDAKRDQQEAARRGITTAELAPLAPEDSLTEADKAEAARWGLSVGGERT